MQRGHALPYPAGIFFDFDGTLADSRDFTFEAHNHVRDVLNLPRFSVAELESMQASTTREIYPRLYGEGAEAAKKLLFDYINHHQVTHLRPFPEVEDMLKYFRKEGIPLGIVSNKDQQSLERAVEGLGWRSYFNALVGAGGNIRAKPYPDPLFAAMRHVGLSLDRVDHVWMVGDHEADMMCAFNAGSVGVLVEHNRDCREILRKCTPHLVIPEICRLRDAFQFPIL